ncbi:MAG: FliH/SctL family protein [Planctomycetota bacterium]
MVQSALVPESAVSIVRGPAGIVAPPVSMPPEDVAESFSEPPAVAEVSAETALQDENTALREAASALRVQLESAQQQHRALQSRLDEAERSLEPLRAQVLQEGEADLVELAMAVAARVVGRELSTDPALVATWAREAVAILLSREGLVVTVSADVAADVAAEVWERSLATPHTLVVDPSLPPQSCEVRAGPASAQAGLDARLSAVRGAVTGDGA